MTLAHGFCLTYLSVAQRRAGDLNASLRVPRLRPGKSLAARSDQAVRPEATVGQAAAYLALGRHEDALVELEAMPVGEQIRPQTRIHSLVLRAMAASAAAPSAAAAFLLSQASEFRRRP